MSKRHRALVFALAALAVAASAAIVYERYRRDIGAAQARVATGSMLAHTACGPIEYGTAGSGAPVLVVHGAGGGFDQGLAFGAPLVAAGYRVIAPSRFGYLRTPLPADVSPAAQADAHACLLDALGVERAIALGGSAGAPSVMQLCLRHAPRCRAMFLLVPIAWAPRPASEPPVEVSPLARLAVATVFKSDFLFWAASALAHDALVEALLATPAADVRAADAREQARMAQALRNALPLGPRARGLAADMAAAAALERYDLERFAVPTLVVSVANDRFGTYRSARYTAQHVRGARFVGYPTGGHLWVGHQDEMWREALGFLGELPANGTREEKRR